MLLKSLALFLPFLLAPTCVSADRVLGHFEATIFGVDQASAGGQKDIRKFALWLEQEYNEASSGDIQLKDLEVVSQFVDHTTTGIWFNTLNVTATLDCVDPNCAMAIGVSRNRYLQTGTLQNVAEQVMKKMINRRDYFKDVTCVKIQSYEAGFSDDSGGACSLYSNQVVLPDGFDEFHKRTQTGPLLDAGHIGKKDLPPRFVPHHNLP